jgi:hypothetical protein
MYVSKPARPPKTFGTLRVHLLAKTSIKPAFTKDPVSRMSQANNIGCGCRRLRSVHIRMHDVIQGASHCRPCRMPRPTQCLIFACSADVLADQTICLKTSSQQQSLRRLVVAQLASTA